MEGIGFPETEKKPHTWIAERGVCEVRDEAQVRGRGESYVGPINDLDLMGWYDDMTCIFQKSHSDCIVSMLLVVVREDVGQAGWEAVSTL